MVYSIYNLIFFYLPPPIAPDSEAVEGEALCSPLSGGMTTSCSPLSPAAEAPSMPRVLVYRQGHASARMVLLLKEGATEDPRLLYSLVGS